MGFIDTLESFNRKERFFLVGYALGNPRFELSETFTTALGEAVGFRIPSGTGAFMDYHLDWLDAAAFLHSASFVEVSQYQNDRLDENNLPARINTGNQEDVDLVIAFQDGENARVLLIEAKGDTSWGNRQLLSKAKRLKNIFGDDGTRVPSVIPTSVLTSPRNSMAIVSSCWPEWMRRGGAPLWMELPWPKGRRRVIGCDQSGTDLASRPYFRFTNPL